MGEDWRGLERGEIERNANREGLRGNWGEGIGLEKLESRYLGN